MKSRAQHTVRTTTSHLYSARVVAIKCVHDFVGATNVDGVVRACVRNRATPSTPRRTVNQQAFQKRFAAPIVGPDFKNVPFEVKFHLQRHTSL